MPSAPSKVIQTNNKEDHEELVSITEKINLTKKQHEVLNIICNTYEESISQYPEEALREQVNRYCCSSQKGRYLLLQSISFGTAVCSQVVM